jgi:hypothetical protein
MSIGPLLAVPIFATAILLSQMAAAATVATSDQCAGGYRDFTVNITAPATGSISCLAVGTGKLERNGPNDVLVQTYDLTYIDKDDKDPAAPATGYLESVLTVSGLGATSGSFTLDQSLWSAYDSLVVAFKVGNNKSPTWAAFTLTLGAFTGTFSIVPPQGSTLSHMNLYGFEPASPVPLPAALPLFASALA